MRRLRKNTHHRLLLKCTWEAQLGQGKEVHAPWNGNVLRIGPLQVSRVALPVLHPGLFPLLPEGPPPGFAESTAGPRRLAIVFCGERRHEHRQNFGGEGREVLRSSFLGNLREGK